MSAKKKASVSAKISEANDRLKAARVGLAIELAGDRLRLRGKLPDKAGKLSRRYISLGILAHAWGIREAEGTAHRIRDLVGRGEFRLKEWRRQADRDRARTAGDWFELFERDYFQRRARTPQTETTYRTEPRAAFRHLDKSRALTVAAMTKAIKATDPGSRTRQRLCLWFELLARFAGLEADFSGLRGTYSAKSVDPRKLPTWEEAIAEIEAIPNGLWRQVFQRLLLFGLRGHEALLLGGFDGDALVVTAGKTGPRKVLPCDRDLFERWEAHREILLPPVSGRTHADLGHRVSTQRRRYGLSFRAYDLRHCYARKLHEAGASSLFAAKMMGHSVRVHEDVYCAWFGFDSYRLQYERLSL
ncbi:MAG: hypothetical protein ACFB9N_05000 [Geitlerinemataceae cyanobacterium]